MSTTPRINITANKIAADAQLLTYKSNKHYGLVKLAEKLKNNIVN